MRVLLEGGEFVNKGAEAMMRTVQAEMSQRFPKASFYVEKGSVRRGTEDAVESAGFTIISSTTTGKKKNISQLLPYILKSPSQSKYIWKNRVQFYKWESILEDIDVVVDISGYRYADSWGTWAVSSARKISTIIHLTNLSNKHYFFLPQAWGPFENIPTLRNICQQNCEGATLFFARDAESRQHLAKLLNKPTEEIRQASDIAFRFRHAGKDLGSKKLLELGIETKKQPLLCVAPNMRIYDRTEGFGAENVYLKLLVKLCLDFIDRGAAIILIPHEIDPTLSRPDDRWLCELIRLAVGSNMNIAAVTRPTPAEELKAMIACCDFLIGSRFHSIVAALQSRVPVVSIGWSHKYQELLNDFGLKKFALDYSDLDDEEISKLVDFAWDTREESIQILNDRLPSIESSAGEVFDHLAEAISG